MVIPYPRIPPTIVSVGPFAIRWYSMMYVVGYVLGYRLVLKRIESGRTSLTRADLDNLIWYLVVGMLIGARLIYVTVYGRGEYAAHPLEVFAVWQGGLSFHGAILGMAVAIILFARRYRFPVLAITDVVALCGTPGLFFGRIGNFINGELYGRPTNVPWAMIFPSDPRHLPRHPSQLYEAFAEGVLLGALLWWIDSLARARGYDRPGLITGLFLVGYAIIRFSLEFTRAPDAQLGLVIGALSMGQLLSMIMFAVGVATFGAQLRLRKGGTNARKPFVSE
ncbi:MAG TPA: prolipoprotein diacylglyceryl transferase [Gemmatimonadaceae bacterium]|nr:prolipoprotein diacylglyceryl transferase [Gemmatimonadaceae bacterium]